jgi:hypothetical protein
MAVLTCPPHRADAWSVCIAMCEVAGRNGAVGDYERALWANMANTRPHAAATAVTTAIPDLNEREIAQAAANALVEAASWEEIRQAREALRTMEGSTNLCVAAMDLTFVFDDWINAATAETKMSVALCTEVERERLRATVAFHRRMYWFVDDVQARALCKPLRDALAKLAELE